MLRIGLDPGVKGCVALVSDERAIFVDVCRHDNGRIMAHRFLTDILAARRAMGDTDPTSIQIENVHAISATVPSVTFGFGRASGVMESVVEIAFPSSPLTYVMPTQWKKHFGLLKCEKKASKAYVLEHFVQYAPRRHDQADALLIALYPAKAHT